MPLRKWESRFDFFISKARTLVLMTNKELGDVVFALKYCFEFYGKTLDKQQLQVWQSIIRSNSYSAVQWTKVLKHYFQIGKFAPKPPVYT